MEKGNSILLSNEIIFNGLTLMISNLTAGFKGYNLLDKRTKKSVVPVDPETNINLKIATQKTDVISQSHQSQYIITFT